MINKFVNYKLLLEKIDPIQELTNDIGLIIHDTIRNNFKTRYLTIYNFQNNEILAHIEANKYPQDDFYEVQRVYAQKGWGWVVYDFILMSLYPNPLIPNNVIKQEALNIWQHYYETRTDIIKQIIPENNSNYRKTYRNDLEGTPQSDDYLKYINILYYLKPMDIYYKYYNNGIENLKKFNIKPAIIAKLGDKKFKEIYWK